MEAIKTNIEKIEDENQDLRVQNIKTLLLGGYKIYVEGVEYYTSDLEHKLDKVLHKFNTTYKVDTNFNRVEIVAKPKILSYLNL